MSQKKNVDYQIYLHIYTYFIKTVKQLFVTENPLFSKSIRQTSNTIGTEQLCAT